MTLLDRPPAATTTRRAAAPAARGATAVSFHDGRAGRVRLRRALILMAMTLVLPGSAQLVVGNRRVGRIAVRVSLGLLVALLVLLGAGLLSQGVVVRLASDTGVLAVLRIVLVVLAVGWALLLIDAWRLGQPLTLRRPHRLVAVAFNGLLVFAVSGSLLFASNLVGVQRGLITALFGDGTASAATNGRYNVLLIGGDSGDDRWGLRTDSMTVASIDEDTGRTVLFGLPRNMSGFPFPDGSAMARRFPDGYDCQGCTLNGLATYAADNPRLFRGSADPGVAATIQGVEGITGLSINYFAMVDLEGFRSLVAAMGGLTLNVRDRIPIGYPARDWIEPGVRKLDGLETLWFARARENADDYSRMARQKCVMSAMLQQLSPQTVITRFGDLAAASEDVVETNLPASELDTFVELALKARTQPVGTVSFVPPRIDTADPDVTEIRSMIATAFERSAGTSEDDERAATERRTKGFAAGRGGSTTGGSLGSLGEGYAANESADLSRAC